MLVMDVNMVDFWNRPDIAVSTLKEFEVDQNTMAMLSNAGMHPLKFSGVLKEQSTGLLFARDVKRKGEIIFRIDIIRLQEDFSY